MGGWASRAGRSDRLPTRTRCSSLQGTCCPPGPPRPSERGRVRLTCDPRPGGSRPPAARARGPRSRGADSGRRAGGIGRLLAALRGPHPVPPRAQIVTPGVRSLYRGHTCTTFPALLTAAQTWSPEMLWDGRARGAPHRVQPRDTWEDLGVRSGPRMPRLRGLGAGVTWGWWCSRDTGPGQARAAEERRQGLRGPGQGERWLPWGRAGGVGGGRSRAGGPGRWRRWGSPELHTPRREPLGGVGHPRVH